MSTYREILRLRLSHAYYGDASPPVDIVPSDPRAFQEAGLLVRRQGEDMLVASDADDLPDWISFDLRPRTADVFTVTRGSQWDGCPLIEAPLGVDDVTLEPLAPSVRPQHPGTRTLAQVRIAPDPAGRKVVVQFDAPDVFWAYHVVGPGSEDAMIEDPEGQVAFDPLGPETLPGGRVSHVLRSRVALPVRARAAQRFALKTPGPFGPKTLIPVLPAPGADFVSYPLPGSSQTRAQADIYVTII